MKIIDSDVLIDLIKEDKFKEVENNAITIITLLEFLRGIEKEEERKAWKKNIENLMKILNIDNKAILIYTKIYRELRREGKILPDADLLQAAIAIANNLVFCTRNVKHFQRLEKFGLKLERYEK